MATFAAYFSYANEDSAFLTVYSHAGSFNTIEDAYLHLLRHRGQFTRTMKAINVDFFVKSGGKRVHLNDPVKMRALMDQVRSEPVV